MSQPRVLVITPWVPYPVTGACQQDRFFGFKQMKKMGWDLRVIANYHTFQDKDATEAAFKQEGIDLTLTPYSGETKKLVFSRLHRILATPALIDGAALEYTHPQYEALLKQTVEEFKPDIIWIEYTHMWPILRLLKPYNIPMIMKSSLNEPLNCRDEHGHSMMSYIKSIPKFGGERIAARESDLILAITPREEEWYTSFGAKKTGVLPLRGLAECFTKRTHTDKPILDVVFMGSNYNIGHNRDAFLFLVDEIIPRVRTVAKGEFRFHITGSKFPDAFKSYLGEDTIYTGFIDDLGAFLETMDIAFSPWIVGQGMQQKVFEPLCRSLPTLTHQTAQYPFVSGEGILIGETPQDFVDHLFSLRSATERQRIGTNAYNKAQELFSEKALMRIMEESVERVL